MDGLGWLEREFQNRQQQEVDARANKEETTISSKRGIMLEMLETPGGLAMKKTAETRQARGSPGRSRDLSQPSREARLVKIAGGQGEVVGILDFLSHSEIAAVQIQKKLTGDGRRALVAIQKRVVFRDSMSIGGR